MDNETANRLIEAMNRHSKAMENLAFQMSLFDTLDFGSAVSDFNDAVDRFTEAN